MRVPRIPLRGSVADGAVRPAPHAGYLRDSRSTVLNTRPAPLRDSRDEIRVAWRRAAGLALDLIQNSGQLRGAADQVVADTVGEELVLNPQPDLSGLGYSPDETAAFVRLVKKRWKHWSWNARECDLRGKFTLPQLIDIALRWDMAFGEAIGLMSYLPTAERQRLGIVTGTKLCMKTPTALVQDTSDWERLFQGVRHDALGRPVAYRFEEVDQGFRQKKDFPAYDPFGRQLVAHVFDPMDAGDVRGISRMAAAFRQHIQREILVDTTIQTSILQTVLAVALSSKAPSKDAFEAIAALDDDKGTFGDEYRDYFLGALDRAATGKITIGSEPQISNLGPDEQLEFKSAGVPGPQFLPVNAALSREMARAIGITYGGLTMDHSAATYSSVRMENSSIWPVVTRRRQRIAAPIKQLVYEHWLDEEIGQERIPFKGGYEAFAGNRDVVCWALWQGPAKPTADDGKSAKASTEKLINGTSSLEIECAELGVDPDELFDQRLRGHNRYIAAGMPSPYVPRNSAPDKGEDKEEPPKPKETA